MAENQSDSSAPRPSGDDPLASLHRMSTTAGVASQEYVAINLFAILAAIGGILSSLIFVSLLFLVIPLVTLVLGFVSLRQIRNSNGTQTGRIGAWVGIVLALVLGGVLCVQLVKDYRQQAADRRQVLALCDAFEGNLLKGDYDAAFAMFTDRFKAEKKVDKDLFRSRMENLAPPSMGKLQSIKSNGLVNLIQSENLGYAQTKLIFRWAQSKEEPRFDVVFVQTPQHGWQIAELPQLFAAPQGPPPAGGAGTGEAGAGAGR